MKKILALVMGAMLLAPAAATAQTFPERQVRLIVPNAAGGGNDIVARLLAEKLTAQWGQPVVVENKPGGNANIGAQFVARAKPDGYTVLVAAGGVIAINPSLFNEMGFSTKDLAPVTLLAAAPYLLAVNPKMVSAKTVPEFIAFAKSRDGKLSWASTSKGSPDHLAGEMFQMATGFKMNHIPYKGGAEALLDVIGDRVELGFFTIPTSLAYIQSGQLRPLGLSDTKRSDLLPDVPTIAEAGVPGYELLTWYGVWVPAGTPKPAIDAINAGFRAALQLPDVQKRLLASGFAPRGNSPAEFADYVQAETEKFAKVIAGIGLKKQ